MPSNVIDILPWFQSVVKMFSDFKIDEKYRVHLLKQYLTPDTVANVSLTDVTRASDFKAVKEALLHEFMLSASELLHRFSALWKLKSETYIVYSNRLKSLLTYYLESLKCDIFQKLIELLVCDRVKLCLRQLHDIFCRLNIHKKDVGCLLRS